jgi:hypothetical protein
MQGDETGKAIFRVWCRRHFQLGQFERTRRVRQLRRSSRTWLLFHELMDDTRDQALHRAIATLAQSDPLIKLLNEVKLGRMKAADAGLRAITMAWLDTYKKVVEGDGMTKQGLLRINPLPRLMVLIEAGVLTNDDQAVTSLQASFDAAFQRAVE